MLNRARLWVRSALLRRRFEREMQAEMAGHIERATERFRLRGLRADEARAQALREFGNVPYLQEQARDARGAQWLDALFADARFAFRQFARRPGMTLVMFIVLSAGISISVLLFSYVHSYAVQPPSGVALADDLVRIRGSQSAGADGRLYRRLSEAEFHEYQQLTDHFAAVAGWTDAGVTVIAGGQGERSFEGAGSFVTPNYFRTLGVQPLLGAGLPADGSETQVAVIGHSLWTRLFGRDPEVIGSTITINGVPFTIVGVAPQRFSGVVMGGSLWLPLASRHAVLRETPNEYRAFARLRPGVDLAEASAAAGVIAARMAANDRDLDALEPSTDVVPLISANSDPMFERDVRLMSLVVGLLGLLVLAITCTNVSALLTGLATGRRHEIAIRLSLGAARKRLIRQLLTESIVLSAAAAATAIFIVWLGLRGVTKFIPVMPFELGITWPATIFTFVVALAVGILFGISPALHATRIALEGALRNSAGTVTSVRGRLQRALVVAQIACTQPLTVLLAGVLIMVFTTMTPSSRTEHGDRVVTMSLHPAVATGGAGPAARAEEKVQHGAAVRRVRDQLQQLPGVSKAIITWRFTEPLGTYVVHESERAAGARADAVQLAGEWVAPGYFDVLGIPLVRGRDFTVQEFSTTEPRGETGVIISSDLARTLWADADPIGRRMQPSEDSVADKHSFVVVGVIDDPLAAARKPGQDYRIYLPPDTAWPPSILARTAQPSTPLLPAMRKVVRDHAPGMITSLRTLAQVEEGQKRIYRMVTAGISGAGLAALFLSAIGLYAVVAFSVAQRTKEIAVRVAIGGRVGQIVRSFIRDGLNLSFLGLLIGLPISILGLHVLTSAVSDVPDVPLPAVAAVAAGGVFIIALAAAWIPARRAASVDPAITLRAES